VVDVGVLPLIAVAVDVVLPLIAVAVDVVPLLIVVVADGNLLVQRRNL
jgi:hypothetical protein